MPLRPEASRKVWSTFDLPILPFLAPRVFTPWPTRNRRAPLSSHAPRCSAEDETLHPFSPTPVEGQRQPDEVRPRRVAAVNRAVLDGVPEDSPLYQTSEEFQRKYAEIWGLYDRKVKERGGEDPTIDPSSKEAEPTFKLSYREWNSRRTLMSSKREHNSNYSEVQAELPAARQTPATFEAHRPLQPTFSRRVRLGPDDLNRRKSIHASKAKPPPPSRQIIPPFIRPSVYKPFFIRTIKIRSGEARGRESEGGNSQIAHPSKQPALVGLGQNLPFKAALPPAILFRSHRVYSNKSIEPRKVDIIKPTRSSDSTGDPQSPPSRISHKPLEVHLKKSARDLKRLTRARFFMDPDSRYHSERKPLILSNNVGAQIKSSLRVETDCLARSTPFSALRRPIPAPKICFHLSRKLSRRSIVSYSLKGTKPDSQSCSRSNGEPSNISKQTSSSKRLELRQRTRPFIRHSYFRPLSRNPISHSRKGNHGKPLPRIIARIGSLDPHPQKEPPNSSAHLDVQASPPKSFQLHDRTLSWIQSSTSQPSLLFWKRSFYWLTHHPKSIRSYYKKITFSHSVKFKFGLIDHEDSATLCTSWLKIQSSRRQQLWPELMHTAMTFRPASVLKLLIATYSEPYPPHELVAACLKFVLVRYFGRADRSLGSEESLQILDAVIDILHMGPQELHIPQSSIHLLVKDLELASIRKVYETLRARDHPLSEDTLMHFASLFMKFKATNLAVEILHTLQRTGIDFSSEKMSALCSTVLEWKLRSSKELYSDNELFKFMLQSGLQPNIIHYTILIQNSLLRGDHETAWQIHNMLIENGIPTDDTLYSILLNDAKKRLDLATIRRVMDIVEKQNLFSPYIVTDILHTTYLLDQQQKHSSTTEQRDNSFEKMLPVFCDYFFVDTLATFIPEYYERYPASPDSAKRRFGTAPQEKTEPSSPTLVVMMTAFLQSIRSYHDIHRLYQNLRHAADAGNPLAIKVLSTTHIYNVVLMALGRFRKAVSLCPLVVENMLKSAILPTVYTWSILLNIFMLHQQPLAAEKVLDLMVARGIQPNVVTWNTLIGGYARLQDESKTADALARLEDSGAEADEVTMKVLGRISNRRALIALMMKREEREKSKVMAAKEERMMESLQRSFDAEEQLRTEEDLRVPGLVVRDIRRAEVPREAAS